MARAMRYPTAMVAANVGWAALSWLVAAATAQAGTAQAGTARAGTVQAGSAQADTIGALVAAAEARGVRTGVAICDSGGGVLYRHRAAEAFAPASNLKVLTAAAVLRGLGADHRFRTAFRLVGGRLVVTASGDPNWIADSAHAPARVFGAVAGALARAGVTAIDGIDLEPGSFVGPTRPPTWPSDQLHTYYCAPTGPFVLEQGTFVLRLEAGEGTDAAVTLLAPPAALPVRGSVAISNEQRGAVYGALDLGDAVRVRGRFWRKSPPVEIRTAVEDPTGWFRAALTAQLRARGIDVGSRPARTDVAAAELRAGARGALVHQHESGLGEALERMLEDSSNFDAEQCLRVLGDRTLGDGSLAGARRALERELRALVGELPAGVVLADGSGLSANNRVTPGLIVVALFRAAGAPGGDALRACLPVAGRSGTLADRFTGSDLVGRVHAKTGWIRGASALSGFVERRDGSRCWFSILMNYDPDVNGLNKELKALQERIVAAIDAMGRAG